MILITLENQSILEPFVDLIQHYPQHHYALGDIPDRVPGGNIALVELNCTNPWAFELPSSWAKIPTIYICEEAPDPELRTRAYDFGALAIWDRTSNSTNCRNLLQALMPSPESMAAEILFRSREKYRRIVDSAPCLILKLDEELNIQFLNHNGLGLDVKHSIGNDFISLLPEQNQEEARQALQLTQQQGTHTGFDALLPWQEGGERQMHFIVSESLSPDGKTGLVLSGMDVSLLRDDLTDMQKILTELRQQIEQRAAELQQVNLHLKQEIQTKEILTKDLAYQKELVQKILNALPIGVILKDAQGHFQLVNDAAPKIFGLPPKKMIGMTNFDLFPEDLAKTYQDDEQKILQDGQPLTKEENIVIDKEVHQYIYGRVPLELEGSGHSHILSFRLDVSDHKKLERKLFHDEKLKSLGTLSGAIAHDFNNLLFAMLLNISLAEKWSSLAPDRPNYFTRATLAGNRAKDLILQILTFSRREDRPHQPTLAVPLIEEGLKLISDALPANITMRQNLQAKLEKVSADPTQLHQILMNICTNAIDSMKEKGGELRIETKLIPPKDSQNHPLKLSYQAYLLLKIQDQGTGMDEKTRLKIFEPYFTTKPIGDGNGMGLSVVHGLVNELNGKIHCNSIVDEGTTFLIYFPITEKDIFIDNRTSPTETNDISFAKDRYSGIKVLYIDDQELVLEAERERLEFLGMKVTSSLNPEKALKLFQEHKGNFDLVITDLGLPIISGDELAKQLISQKNNLPVILVTGYPDKIHNPLFKQIGIRRVLIKPVLTDALINALDEILQPA